MATHVAKKLIGDMDCMACNRVIPVKRSENGTLHFACPYCALPGYGKVGEEVHQIAMARTRLKNVPNEPAAQAPQARAATKPVAPTPPAPAPRRASSIFDLGSNAA